MCTLDPPLLSSCHSAYRHCYGEADSFRACSTQSVSPSRCIQRFFHSSGQVHKTCFELSDSAFGFMGYSIRVADWRCESAAATRRCLAICTRLLSKHTDLGLCVQTPSGGNGTEKRSRENGTKLGW